MGMDGINLPPGPIRDTLTTVSNVPLISGEFEDTLVFASILLVGSAHLYSPREQRGDCLSHSGRSAPILSVPANTSHQRGSRRICHGEFPTGRHPLRWLKRINQP
jgi:hypothetical protein